MNGVENIVKKGIIFVQGMKICSELIPLESLIIGTNVYNATNLETNIIGEIMRSKLLVPLFSFLMILALANNTTHQLPDSLSKRHHVTPPGSTLECQPHSSAQPERAPSVCRHMVSDLFTPR